MAEKQRILFLCRGNSARSQMAEALLRHIGRRHFEAFSAGTNPEPAVFPVVIDTLKRNRVPVDGLAPKDVSMFVGQSFDLVVCLCDRDGEELTPMPGADVIRWSFPDPAKSEDPSVRTRLLEDVFRGLERRIRLLMVVGTTRARSETSAAAPPF